jgi:uncharacterized membrane protein
MTHVEKTIEVDVPVRMAYNQWTQFEQFPRFMKGIESVRQLDASHLAWKAKIGGKPIEWTAEITEQVPDRLIAWHSVTGARNQGRLTFEPRGAKTAVHLALDYEPEGFAQGTGDALGLVSHRIRQDLQGFKDFVEKREAETGAWRGEIHHGVPGAESSEAAERAAETPESPPRAEPKPWREDADPSRYAGGPEESSRPPRE